MVPTTDIKLERLIELKKNSLTILTDWSFSQVELKSLHLREKEDLKGRNHGAGKLFHWKILPRTSSPDILDTEQLQAAQIGKCGFQK
mmetsp:Transcript_10526/g.31008  ORF Transcript_10526/g.31008 Transcript_10526/m.31008 type:complete len:87 (+) Transcript_10526:795-1055(+)